MREAEIDIGNLQEKIESLKKEHEDKINDIENKHK